MHDYDNFDDVYVETFTYDELHAHCDEEHNVMTEQEQSMRAQYCDPTFYEWLLSHIHPGDIVHVDESGKRFKLNDDTEWY